MKLISVLLAAVVLVVAMASVALAEPKGDLIIFHAGSLSKPMAQMEKEFEAKYPGVDVLREAGGSTKMARMISDVGKPADIMASADYKVIDNNLIPNFADVDIRFATNQMVLCYTDQSKFADEINKDNWYEILGREGVAWGHSDPNLDPCGYRSLMVLQLAEKYYKIEGLYEKLVSARPKENIRPKSVELISLLETGNMDYAWEYLSVAVQHNLKYLKLPVELNLSDYKFDDFYAEAKVEVTGKAPGEFITKKGQSITYGVTLIKDSPNPEAAVVFMEFMLSPEGGLKILDEQGQPPFVPARVTSEEMAAKLPAGLKNLVEVKN